MPTRDQKEKAPDPRFQQCVDDVRAVCKKHGLLLVGVCASEGIFGEIMLVDPLSTSDCRMGHIKEEGMLSNLVEFDLDGDTVVLGIGDLPS